MNLADEFRSIRMGWIWTITFVIVVVFGGVLTPWETIEYLIANRGMGEEGANLLAVAAGYTLPLTAGFSVIAFLVLAGIHKQFSFWAQVLGATIILWLAGEAARSLDLGLLPDYTGWSTVGGGHWVVRLFAIVLGAYFTTYGWGLMVCAFAIGCAIAFQVERWLHSDVRGDKS